MSREAVIGACEQANLPFSPVAEPQELFTDPQLIEGEGLAETLLPTGERANLPRVPIRLGDHGFPLRNQPPEVGQFSADLLRDLGYSEAEIEQLTADQIVRATK